MTFHTDGALNYGVVKDENGTPISCFQCVEGREDNGPSVFVIVEWNLKTKQKRVSKEEFSSQTLAILTHSSDDLTWSEWK
jgi:hypothetical protein